VYSIGMVGYTQLVFLEVANSQFTRLGLCYLRYGAGVGKQVFTQLGLFRTIVVEEEEEEEEKS